MPCAFHILHKVTMEATDEFGIPVVLLWTASACSLLAYMQYYQLVERGYTPLKGRPLSLIYISTFFTFVHGNSHLHKLPVCVSYERRQYRAKWGRLAEFKISVFCLKYRSGIKIRSKLRLISD